MKTLIERAKEVEIDEDSCELKPTHFLSVGDVLFRVDEEHRKYIIRDVFDRDLNYASWTFVFDGFLVKFGAMKRFFDNKDGYFMVDKVVNR